MKLALALIAMGLPSVALAMPQEPLATGRIESILPAIRAAHSCGFDRLRTEPSIQGRLMLFADGEPKRPSGYNCVRRWVAAHARRLHLLTGYQRAID